MRLFPEVTTSRDEFIKYIIIICEVFDVQEEMKETWIKHVSSMLMGAHYFHGMIFIEELRPIYIFHELVHHFAQILRNITGKSFWYKIDKMIDDIDIAIFS